ncbi:hypothetical protein JOF56_003970 [Kibdelosporangium banguiense]|uniref:Tail terminator n=1 Tax=Kibdelosporangium banguiense TaxID=1365924 RepID=A0ABS4THT9_9PSEU|nr:hypothetical protein [Kibdelosporangium banguiense]MBP2323585.1 hypothetical protein [Kibdelosporangium banguiense]
MGQPLVFPNVERVIVAFLDARPELDGVAVGIDLPPGFDGTQRAVRVSRVGGVFIEDDLRDNALTRIDAYGPDKTAAHSVASLVRGVLPLVVQQRLADGAVISDVTETEGPYWFPDSRNANASRYYMRHRFAVAVRAT